MMMANALTTTTMTTMSGANEDVEASHYCHRAMDHAEGANSSGDGYDGRGGDVEATPRRAPALGTTEGPSASRIVLRRPRPVAVAAG
jgi:hypothetical protein